MRDTLQSWRRVLQLLNDNETVLIDYKQEGKIISKMKRPSDSQIRLLLKFNQKLKNYTLSDGLKIVNYIITHLLGNKKVYVSFNEDKLNLSAVDCNQILVPDDNGIKEPMVLFYDIKEDDFLATDY